MKEFLELNPEGIFDEIENHILSQPNPALALISDNVIVKIDSDKSLEEILTWILKMRKFCNSVNPENKERLYGPYDHSTITDIFRLINYYKPNTKLKDVYVALVYGSHNKQFRSWICNSILKRTYDADGDWGFTSKLMDEYGVKFPTPPVRYMGYGIHNTELRIIKYKKDV